MNKKSLLLIILLAVLLLISIYPSYISDAENFFGSLINKIDGQGAVFFVDSKDANELASRYKNSGKVNILIVPGHDDEFWGTEFRGLREADANLYIAENIYKYLSQDSNLNVKMSRDANGYMPAIKDYFTNRASEVKTFISKQSSEMKARMSTGQVQEKSDGVYHNNAKSDVALRLYSINKWANDNAIDIIISVHINDHAGRRTDVVGKYNGFTVYIPEKHFSNSKASRPLGEAVAKNLKKVIPESNLPREGDVVEDQELIAIGASNSLDAVSLLVEYGYIYEPQYQDKNSREAISKEYAFLTSKAVKEYLGGSTNNNTPLAQMRINSSLKKGDSGSEAAVLQKVLALAGVYPAQGSDFRDCYITGTFGPCTERALKEFQKQNGLEPTGEVGPKTREKLNNLVGIY